jgi:hypothetical protein
MAENTTPTKPAEKPTTIRVTMVRDYWPKSRPDGMPADEEHRVRAGETAPLPTDEAMDVVEAGIGTRFKG